MDKILDEFGKILINEVRDRTISIYDMALDGEMQSARYKELAKEVKKLSDPQRKLLNRVVMEVTDSCLHNMMCMIEDNYEEMVLLMRGKNIAEISDGLAGELYTEDGWIQRFSEERFDERM